MQLTLWKSEKKQFYLLGEPYIKLPRVLYSILYSRAINSPQVLELSGIGERSVLEKAGIDVKLELPGVGNNMQDHYYLGLTYGLYFYPETECVAATEGGHGRAQRIAPRKYPHLWRNVQPRGGRAANDPIVSYISGLCPFFAHPTGYQ